jgi:hypothetical protein
VISSDLATNVTDKNIAELAQIEQNMKEQRLAATALKEQEKANLAKAKPQEMSAVDKAILESTGAVPKVDPFKVEAENGLKNIKMQVENLSRQVDPYTANVLNDIQNLYEVTVNEANG